ncbi:MAG: glycosyltransferase family 4 protein [Chloroflexota bacterium]
MPQPKRICIFPSPRSIGGPASFRNKFASGLRARGIEVSFDLDDLPYDAILLISGSRHLGKLRSAARRGIPIIQRLDGINWIHRLNRFNPRHYLKSEYGNLLLNYTRLHLANRIIYQSEFVARRWEQVYQPAPVAHNVIHNAVDLKAYSPEGTADRPTERFRIMLVEGSFASGHDIGLKIALDLAHQLESQHQLPSELTVAGVVPPETQAQWNRYTRVPINWLGVVPGDKIPYYNRSAHLYFSAELNPPCPNSVIEALACGLPVVGYDTGSLAELVGEGNAGRIVAYGADPWRLETPDIPALAAAAAEVLNNQEKFRRGARQRAEQAFALDVMVERYLEAISQA